MLPSTASVIFLVAGIAAMLVFLLFARGRSAIAKHRRERDAHNRQASDLQTLHTLSLGMIGHLDLDNLLESIVQGLMKLIGADEVAVYLSEDEGRRMVLHVGQGETFSRSTGLEARKGRGVVGHVWETRELVVLKDYQGWPQRIPDKRFDGFRASAAVPILSGETVVGVLVLAYREASRIFGAKDINALRRFGSLVAVALDNARNLEALRKSERRFRTVLDRISDAIMVIDASGRIRFANPAAEAFFGRTSGELIGSPFGMPLMGQGTTEINFVSRDGKTGFGELQSVETDWEGEPVTFVSMRDITDRKAAEAERVHIQEQFRQVQKLEAIGTLAGGIAHDFNNILSAVIGFSQICMEQVEPGSQLESNLREVLHAGNRAKFLVKQILAFSRQAEVEMQPTTLKPLVKEVLKMIRASIPTTIDIRHEVFSDTPVQADATQMHQVLMNLCTNATHAMQETGGTLTVRLEDVVVDESAPPGGPTLSPGCYVKMSVSDTGYGIDPSIHEKIFDPFFTTKDKGEGTGMGLAVIHGIVQEHGGAITVDSRPGHGSRFDVYLPAIASPACASEGPEAADSLPGGKERILVVDDEAPIVKMIDYTLNKLGYAVTTFTRSRDALGAFLADPDGFDLLITDMTMPEMTGKELARRALSIRPDFRVILCTGFSKLISEDDARKIGIAAMIFKPVLKEELVVAVRRVLDGGPASASCLGEVPAAPAVDDNPEN